MKIVDVRSDANRLAVMVYTCHVEESVLGTSPDCLPLRLVFQRKSKESPKKPIPMELYSKAALLQLRKSWVSRFMISRSILSEAMVGLSEVVLSSPSLRIFEEIK